MINFVVMCMDSSPSQFTFPLCYTVPEIILYQEKAQTSVISRIRRKPKVALLSGYGENSHTQLLSPPRKPKASSSTIIRKQEKNKLVVADFSALACWKQCNHTGDNKTCSD
jgi:hypothetical protein